MHAGSRFCPNLCVWAGGVGFMSASFFTNVLSFREVVFPRSRRFPSPPVHFTGEFLWGGSPVLSSRAQGMMPQILFDRGGWRGILFSEGSGDSPWRGGDPHWLPPWGNRANFFGPLPGGK